MFLIKHDLVSFQASNSLALEPDASLLISFAEPSQGEYALDLLMIAKYFERIGDHCTNIAEWVEFFVTGVHKDCQ